MKNLRKILECKEGKRCNLPLSCPKCGEIWRRAKFKAFIECLPAVIKYNKILTYIVIKSNELNTLREGLSEILNFMDDLRELKKRGKLPTIYSRLEVSFGKKYLGFNPHLNMLVWGDISKIIELAKKHNLKFWKRSKENNIDTAKSIAWYMLKFNNIGIEKGEAVRKALNKRTTLFYTKEFNHKTEDYIDEIIDIDFRFLGVYPVRSKAEIEFRKFMKEVKRKLNQELKRIIDKENKKLENTSDYDYYPDILKEEIKKFENIIYEYRKQLNLLKNNFK